MATRAGEWKPSDPGAVAQWFRDCSSVHGEQLQRICRYVKAWRDFHWTEGGPSSILLMILVTQGFVANPRRADVSGRRVSPFAGALAIVVDSLSMSTSEIFAAGMQAVGRARLFGENTPGLALPAVMVRLPTGDVLMHVFADFTDPTGRRIEGAGVVPDVAVPLSRADLRRGLDAPVATAVDWIAATSRPAHSSSALTSCSWVRTSVTV